MFYLYLSEIMALSDFVKAIYCLSGVDAGPLVTAPVELN